MEVGLAGLLAGQAALRDARSLDGGLCLSLQEGLLTIYSGDPANLILSAVFT